jgi:hypothetical protein
MKGESAMKLEVAMMDGDGFEFVSWRQGIGTVIAGVS